MTKRCKYCLLKLDAEFDSSKARLDAPLDAGWYHRVTEDWVNDMLGNLDPLSKSGNDHSFMKINDFY